MSEHEEQLLMVALREGTVMWRPEDGIGRRVVSIGLRKDEPGLCANFSNGEYAALYNCQLEDFVTASPIHPHPLLNSTEPMSEKIREVIELTAAIFDDEPTDAADFKDASARILTAWRLAKQALSIPAAPTSEWISVRERKPDREMSVPVTDGIRTGWQWYHPDMQEWWGEDSPWGINMPFTHWLELPDPPSIPQGEEQYNEKPATP